MAYLPDDDAPTNQTMHALDRIAERNVNPKALDLLCREADLRLPGRDNCWRHRLSRSAAKRLDRDRAYPRRTIEQARDLEAVVSPDGCRVITVWRHPADMRFRRAGSHPHCRRHRKHTEE